MLSLTDALAAYAGALAPLETETVATVDALGRCLAAPACAAFSLPRFTQTAVDGYALLSLETGFASPSAPLRLRVAGEIPAGRLQGLPALRAGEAWRVLTGASLPRGADSVVAQEDVRVENGELILSAPVGVDRNIRHAGEELGEGETLATAGQRLTPGLQAALLMAGADRVCLRRRPRVRLLVTGDELRPAGARLAEGEIIDSNGPLVRAMLQALGHAPPPVIHVRDSADAVAQALAQALDESDLVISTGGVSVGDRDFIPDTARRLGLREVFWKVAQKPGKPLFFGVRAGSALLGLPGNPAAVLVGMLLHVRHALDVLEGVAVPGAPLHAGRLAGEVAADARRDRLLRMRLRHGEDASVILEPLERQDSHMLSNLRDASVLALLPARGEPYPAGSLVRWTPLPAAGII